MDYFSRRAPSSREKTGSPEQSKENCQTSQSVGKQTSPVAAVKQSSQKRGKKAIKAARKLVEAETVGSTADASLLIVDESHESKDSTAEVTSSCGVLGNDTAAPLAQHSAEACNIPERSVTMTVSVEQAEKYEHHEDGSKCGNNLEFKPEIKSIASSPVVPLRDKGKQVKTAARNSRKRQQQEAKQPEPEEKEVETSLCDVSMEINVDQDSQLSNSTVTISFEDFVRSQSQDKGEDDIEDEQSNEEESE